MKTIADTLPNADKVLTELLGFMESAQALAEASAPYAIASNGRALPRFIAETSTALKKALIPDFARYFPSLQDLVENGAGGTQSMGRLHNACYMFNQGQQVVHAAKCMLKDDNIRQKVTDLFRTTVGDIAVFICIQFGLHNLDSGEVTLAISKHCERCRLTPDVFYGILKQTMEDVERSWYAYEVMSPMYGPLNDFDPVFLAECEENFYPLTDDIAKRIVEGEVDVAEVRGTLVEHMRNTIETDVDVTPSTLVSRMQLQ